MAPAGPPVDPWLARVAGDSPVGQLVAAFDWGRTSIGPSGSWPPALRSAIELCVQSRFPMLVLWGPDLLQIYNDGHAAMIGTKHPDAIGSPAQEVWAEIWDVIGPLFRQVLDTGRATWLEDQRLDVQRHGFLEETYFTYSYSPIRDDAGNVGGVLDIATETTGQVVTARRISFVAELASALLSSRDIDEVRASAAALLATSADIEAARLEPVVGQTRSGVQVLDRNWSPGRPAVAVAVAVGGSAQQYRLVLELNQRRPFDDGYRSFVELVATAIGAALDNVRHRLRQGETDQEMSRRLQEAMLELTTDYPTVAARYVPASDDLRVGGDWYDVIALGGGRRGLVVGDCVGHGIDAAIAMGQLRSACRALLLAGASPADVLGALDRVAAAVTGGGCATVACIVIDVPAGQLTYACAGHPPPLLVSAAGSPTWLLGGRGMPLAVGDPERRDERVTVRSGDTVVLYTDGVIERRGEDLDAGLDRVAAETTRLAGQPVQVIADALLRLAEGADDDVAIVVKRVP